MNKHTVLSKVYAASTMVIVSIVLLACLLCKWPVFMIMIAVLTSLVAGSPALFSLQILLWLSEKIRLQKAFAWMLLLAAIPPLALVVAWLVADYVPGKIWFLLLLGMAGGYIGMLRHAISVSQFFNPDQYE